ncbi:MAG: cobalt ECF transporter T component CbiQ [Lentisphaeria bacterium]|nr:cobalt ECF transporter T component CbiQ [Lentisphaeria bacterium]
MVLFDAPPDSVIQRLDPRVRVATAFAFAVVVCFSRSPDALGFALVLGFLAVVLGRPSLRQLLRALLTLNVFLGLLAATLIVSVPGRDLFRLGPLAGSRAGFAQGMTILCRANAIVPAVASLLGTMEPAYLGWALAGLGVPTRLAQILAFMVRYVEVIHVEYHRLRDAMALRCFQARCDCHTLRTFGHLVGLLLVRSLERAQRIVDAMRCRGFTGHFHVLRVFRCGVPDAIFAALTTAALALLIFLEVQ